MGRKSETVNILYASNDGFARHLAASLASLMDSNRQIPCLAIYILSIQMSEITKRRLKGMGDSFGRSVTVIELGDLRERFPYPVDSRGFHISAMGRLFAPQVLPRQVEKVLYLDCDTIVCGSILPLYNTELGEYPLGMVMEPTVYQEIRDSIGFQKDEPYFNSGVLLINLEKWRQDGVLDSFLNFYGKHGGKLFACDQDTINGALKGKILSLPPKYNFFANYRYYRYATLCGQCGAYKTVGKKAFQQAKAHPVVIHFLGDERPWIRGNRNYYRRLYEEWLNQTPWKGYPKEKGKEFLMLMWWAFNRITWICPSFRFWISGKFGLRWMDSRGKRKKNG